MASHPYDMVSGSESNLQHSEKTVKYKGNIRKSGVAGRLTPGELTKHRLRYDPQLLADMDR
jgi:hypothetical protein